MIARKSTRSWALKHTGHIPSIREALELPMVTEILRTIDEHRGATFFVMAPAQVFKSLVGQLRAMRSMQVEPVESLWYGPTDKNLDDFAAEKFTPLFDACEPLGRLLYDDPNKRTAKRINFPFSTYFRLLTAVAEANRQSKTARDIYFDEAWLFQPGWISQIQSRRASYPDSFREILMSTGPDRDTPADVLWENTDKRTWHSRCPSCGEFFVPRFLHRSAAGEIIGGVRFTKVLRDDGLPDAAAIKESTTYQCPHCQAKFPDLPSSRVALNGTAEAPKGAFLALNSRPAPAHYGFQTHGGALRPWWQLAVKFVSAQLARKRGDLTGMANLVRMDFGEVWDPDLYFKDKVIRQPSGYVMGEDWEGELKDDAGRPWRFGTIDVQEDHYYLVIRMWGRFSQSRLRFVARVMSVSDLAVHLEEHKVEKYRTFIDARYDTSRVRRIASMMGWLTVMGDKDNRRGYRHKDGIFRIYSEPTVHDPLIGTPEQGRGQRVVQILFSKQQGLDRLHLLRTQRLSAVGLDPDGRGGDNQEGPALWLAADNVPEWYWTQVDGHRRSEKTNPDGSVSRIWIGQKADHAGDVEVIQVVAASIAGLTGAESLEGPSVQTPEKPPES